MMRACSWPGCTHKVPARMWGCSPHWFALPPKLRNLITKYYRPGQETDLALSDEYVRAFAEVRDYAVGRCGQVYHATVCKMPKGSRCMDCISGAPA